LDREARYFCPAASLFFIFVGVLDPNHLVHCVVVKCMRVLKRGWLSQLSNSNPIRLVSDYMSDLFSQPPPRQQDEFDASDASSKSSYYRGSSDSGSSSARDAADSATDGVASSDSKDTLYHLMRESLEKCASLTAVTADYSALRHCTVPGHSGCSLHAWTTSDGGTAASLVSNCACQRYEFGLPYRREKHRQGLCGDNILAPLTHETINGSNRRSLPRARRAL